MKQYSVSLSHKMLLTAFICFLGMHSFAQKQYKRVHKNDVIVYKNETASYTAADKGRTVFSMNGKNIKAPAKRGIL
jgi:chaperone required for assembly of F1-ATPase